jgi:hypothetical protein
MDMTNVTRITQVVSDTPQINQSMPELSEFNLSCFIQSKALEENITTVPDISPDASLQGIPSSRLFDHTTSVAERYEIMYRVE